MKTKKMIGICAIALASVAPSLKGENRNNSSPSGDGDAAALQCGVSNAEIQRYLETCSHHHTVYSVWDVPGTCNSKANIENCQIATVYVSGGFIITHLDAPTGICE